MTIEPMYADSGIYKPILPDCEYVIVNALGNFYTGRSGYASESALWTSNPLDAFKYTQGAARSKLDTFPIMFGPHCKIVRI